MRTCYSLSCSSVGVKLGTSGVPFVTPTLCGTSVLVPTESTTLWQQHKEWRRTSDKSFCKIEPFRQIQSEFFDFFRAICDFFAWHEGKAGRLIKLKGWTSEKERSKRDIVSLRWRLALHSSSCHSFDLKIIFWSWQSAQYFIKVRISKGHIINLNEIEGLEWT